MMAHRITIYLYKLRPRISTKKTLRFKNKISQHKLICDFNQKKDQPKVAELLVKFCDQKVVENLTVQQTISGRLKLRFGYSHRGGLQTWHPRHAFKVLASLKPHTPKAPVAPLADQSIRQRDQWD